MALTKAVANLHEAGVAHANISLVISLYHLHPGCVAMLPWLIFPRLRFYQMIISVGIRIKDGQEAFSARMKFEDMKALGLMSTNLRFTWRLINMTDYNFPRIRSMDAYLNLLWCSSLFILLWKVKARLRLRHTAVSGHAGAGWFSLGLLIYSTTYI
jgi:hypothetical protein